MVHPISKANMSGSNLAAFNPDSQYLMLTALVGARKQLDSKCSCMKLDAQNNSANIHVDWTSVTWRANQICPEQTNACRCIDGKGNIVVRHDFVRSRVLEDCSSGGLPDGAVDSDQKQSRRLGNVIISPVEK
ncbi:hypothetical protein RHMOL_Rhmol12G0084800 [Rhododendron molle]|uniref:Uncharacterized protein n=1 Tax=Rhododendron molle TaxID=49168 RepID=A0ACC0LG38_RHOML|nr:hypothetical protein RHMOL_Rhmol12G0084800 [Rhododendron molle]